MTKTKSILVQADQITSGIFTPSLTSFRNFTKCFSTFSDARPYLRCWIQCTQDFPFQMAQHLSWPGKSFIAPFATEWLFSCVSSCMQFQVWRHLERLLTKFTLKGPNFTMTNHMRLQIVFAKAHFSTHATEIQSFWFVREHVCLQIDLCMNGHMLPKISLVEIKLVTMDAWMKLFSLVAF